MCTVDANEIHLHVKRNEDFFFFFFFFLKSRIFKGVHDPTNEATWEESRGKGWVDPIFQVNFLWWVGGWVPNSADFIPSRDF
jgi:hypothetical protein